MRVTGTARGLPGVRVIGPSTVANLLTGQVDKINLCHVQNSAIICPAVGNALKEWNCFGNYLNLKLFSLPVYEKFKKKYCGNSQTNRFLKACILYQCPSMGSYFLFACHVFSFAYHGTYLACKLFFRALEFTLRTGDKVNLFRLVGYYIERKNRDRLLKPGPRLEAARWLAAGQLHIEAKWGEVIKEDDGGAKKGEWQWQRWTMGVGDDETGTDGQSFYYRSTNSGEMAGHWREAASSDEKVIMRKRNVEQDWGRLQVTHICRFDSYK